MPTGPEHTTYPLMQQDPDGMRQLFHLAMSGIDVSSHGLWGPGLAKLCAFSLREAGHPDGQACVKQVRDLAFRALMDPAEARYPALAEGLTVALEEFDEGLVGGLEELAFAHDVVAQAGLYGFNAKQVVETKSTEYVLCSPLPSLRMALLASKKLCDVNLQVNFAHGEQAMSPTSTLRQGYGTYVELLDSLVQKDERTVGIAFEELVNIREELAEYLSEEFDDRTVTLLEHISDLVHHPAGEARKVALRALQKLREHDPESRAYRKKVKRLAGRSLRRRLIASDPKDDDEKAIEEKLIHDLNFGRRGLAGIVMAVEFHKQASSRYDVDSKD